VSKSNVQALGVSFFNGNISDACELAKKGGLITAPSGPGLAQDLSHCPEYRRALELSDLVLADSGLLCLWKKWIEKKPLSRISGLVFLQGILKTIDWEKKGTFWVMPDEGQAEANRDWIRKTFGASLSSASIYIAPQYKKTGGISDPSLLAQIEESRPNLIFIQVGGGVQERLGLFLKENLSYTPSIFCTGAALAFLSGQQANIPRWADSLYLGWLLRCVHRPNIFIPRYLKAFRLVYLLAKYGKNRPPIRG
jgi:N-acetylglucosaminyldiphosphoundecaprenol N-acetyl-beta-D-mannosaminyltransferase